ncbi:MAG: FmdB family zinc ribbon protein [Actinomycetota bacterium]
MPTYEYACTSCGRRFEAIQGFSEGPLETCEVCGGRLQRVFHPVGVLFKGSGFYSTDSRTHKEAGGGGDGKGEKKGPSSTEKASGSSDKKPNSSSASGSSSEASTA